MTDVNESVNVEEVVVESQEQTVEDSTNELDTIKKELDEKRELIKQLRKYEKSQKEAAQKAMEEQGKYQQLYEESLAKISQFESKVKQSSVDAAISEAAKEFGVKSLSTLTKLIDSSKIEFNDDNTVNTQSLKSLIIELQKTDSILFELPEVNTPVLKKANEDTGVANYEIELKKATTHKEIEAVMRKYGKL